MDKLWLPEGHHYDLHIEHGAAEDAGEFTGGGWKLCWHITVSPWNRVDGMVDTVIAKRSSPHFVIGGRPGVKHPVVVQLIPLDRAGRTLKHTLPEETNRANCVQIEVCATPASVEAFKRDGFEYMALGNLARLIERRVKIPRKLARRFVDTRRYSGPGYVKAAGHHGHMHVPGNDHIDPTTKFQGNSLLRCIANAPNDL
jgi:hypothetical protein